MLPKDKFVDKKNYNVRVTGNNGIIKLWNKHVTIEDAALFQLDDVASMPFVKPWVAAMPDTHWGMGATVGSVIPTQGAIMPAAVGVDIGCGMMAVRTTIPALGIATEDLKNFFDAISKAVPHGRTDNGGVKDIGAWPENGVPADIHEIWEREFAKQIYTKEVRHGNQTLINWDLMDIFKRHPGALSKNAERHLGTLGTGNHFIEVCTEIDNPDSNLWVVIHSGSRGFGNRIGSYFTRVAGELCNRWQIKLPSKDLGYLPQGTQEYDDYITALNLAQHFAWVNREIMMDRVLKAIGAEMDSVSILDKIDAANDFVPPRIHMHHNYADIEGSTVLTRKGAVDASRGKYVIIPGSMGAKTYIARGLGNKDSFYSCSHGAGRAMSRGEALKTFSVADHEAATQGVYCDKTRGVLDETPGAYKDIDAVMESQRDLVEPVLKLKQLVCVKGLSD